MTAEDRRALREWEAHHANLLRDLSVNMTETETEKFARRTRLEASPEAWFKYYFPKYYSSDPAPFHLRATKRILENDRWWDLRAWSRELAKSVRTMMEVTYLALAKKEVRNTLMIANNEKDAIRLLTPFRVNLEQNRRILHDYGKQRGANIWKSEEFVTRHGVSFRAIGAGQSPRGTRAEEARVDCLIFDDIDTDEECRNEMRIKEKFRWIQEAVLPTVSISGKYRIITNGNIIAKVCTVELCKPLASHVDVINIRDKHGRSVWAKNSEADIDRFFQHLTYSAIQKEFFNNPITEGSVFPALTYKPARPLRDYKLLVAYTDPSWKDTKKNDYKATVLVGRWKDEFHVLKAFVDQTTTATMIGWHYEIDDYVKDRVPVYHMMEANFMQDSLIKEFYGEGVKRGKVIPISGDERKKDDKFSRIEALLEPLNRNGKFYLNAAEKDHPGMKTLEEQFLMLEPGSRAHDDGPDAVEGAVFALNRRHSSREGIATFPTKHRNPKRY